MTARTRHFARHDDFVGPEHATEVLCGTESKQGPTLWATDNEAEVTCKKCLKVIAQIEEEHASQQGAVLAEETERFLSLVAEGPVDTAPIDIIPDELPRESLYVTTAYLTPTGPLVESVHDIVIPRDFDDKSIAQRHGLERFEVENAINDGWLKR